MVLIYEKTPERKVRQTTLFLALLIPCLLAGVRASNVGTDTNGYAKLIFDAAYGSRGLVDFFNSTIYYEWKMVKISYFEYGFTLLAFITAKVLGSFSSFLFFSEFLTLFPIYSAYISIKKKFGIEIWLCLVMFFCLFYNITFNAIRQSIALAFIFWGTINYYTQKPPKTMIIPMMVSILFHRSAIVYVFAMLLVSITIRGKRKIRFVRIGILRIGINNFFSAILIFAALFIVLGGNKIIVQLLEIINLARFSNYINGTIRLSINQLLLQVPYIGILLAERKRITSRDQIQIDTFMTFLMLMFSLNIILSQLATITPHSWRATMLFALFNTLYFPLIHQKEKSLIRKKIISITLIGYSVVYWYYNFVLTGRHATVPYRFFFN